MVTNLALKNNELPIDTEPVEPVKPLTDEEMEARINELALMNPDEPEPDKTDPNDDDESGEDEPCEDANATIELYPQWKQAAETLISEKRKPGDLISKQWLYENFNIPEPYADKRMSFEEFSKNEQLFSSYYRAFERYLLDKYNMVLKNVYGQGYLIVPPDEQAHYSYSTSFEKIIADVKRGSFQLKRLDFQHMSDCARKDAADLAAKFASQTNAFQRRNLRYNEQPKRVKLDDPDDVNDPDD
jgi:hypothetical protein